MHAADGSSGTVCDVVHGDQFGAFVPGQTPQDLGGRPHLARSATDQRRRHGRHEGPDVSRRGGQLEPRLGFTAFDLFDVDPVDRAVNGDVVFEPGVDPRPGHGRGVRDDPVDQTE